MNKKAIFLPLFVFISILILTTLFFVINSINKDREDLVGLRAVTLTRLYDEVDKQKLFINLAAQQSSDNALISLDKNGGISESSSCQKTPTNLVEQESYTIFNTCDTKIQEEFNYQLRLELKKFFTNYQSRYNQINFINKYDLQEREEFFQLKDNTSDAYNTFYTNTIKNLEVQSIQLEDNKLNLKFNEIVYPIEGSENSVYNFEPQSIINSKDLSIYSEIHNTLNNNCVKKDFEICQSKIKEQFPRTTLSKAGEIVKLDIPHGQRAIKIAFSNT